VISARRACAPIKAKRRRSRVFAAFRGLGIALRSACVDSLSCSNSESPANRDSARGCVFGYRHSLASKFLGARRALVCPF
jgi:hypothetical protein